MFQKMLGLVVQQRYTTSGYSVKGFESLMQWYTLSIFLKWSQLWIFIPLYSLWAKKKRLWDRGLEKLKMLLTFFFLMIEKIIVFIYVQGKNKLFNVEMNYGKAEIIAFDTFYSKICLLYLSRCFMQHMVIVQY